MMCSHVIRWWWLMRQFSIDVPAANSVWQFHCPHSPFFPTPPLLPLPPVSIHIIAHSPSNFPNGLKEHTSVQIGHQRPWTPRPRPLPSVSTSAAHPKSLTPPTTKQPWAFQRPRESVSYWLSILYSFWSKSSLVCQSPQSTSVLLS